MNPHVIVVSGSYKAAFCLNDSEELLETVEFDEEGNPDFEEAGICDPVRGSDSELQHHLRAALLRFVQTV